MKRVIQAKKLSSYFMTAVVLAALAVGAEPGHAGLLAKSPNNGTPTLTSATSDVNLASTSFSVDGHLAKPINQSLGTTDPVLAFGVIDANPNPAHTVVRLDGTALVNPISGTTTPGPFTAGSSSDSLQVSGNCFGFEKSGSFFKRS